MWSINGLNYELKSYDSNKVAIDVCTQLGYDIPRFCYHENSKIAGNCRMRLIEDIKAPKPIICCAMNVSNNLTIFTNTLRVKKARESVMEFLLINHPLDCPICDQGGECDSQDLALVYGSDHGRFYEYKRNVEDKNCGLIIKTIMNRCILCTRCVRFSTDISNFTTFGVTGRGSKMEIGSYIEKTLTSDLSGNLVDVCPVGASTSKPYSFLARPWELKKTIVLNVFDDYVQQIRADVKENNLIRLMPTKNNLKINTWITNRVRFSYEGLQRSRLTSIFINTIEASWLKFLNVFADVCFNLLNFINKINLPLTILSMWDLLGLKTIMHSQNFIFNTGSSYILSKNNVNIPTLEPIFNLDSNLDNNVIGLFGLNLEWDAPILNILLNNFSNLTIITRLSVVNFKKFDILHLDSSISSNKNLFLAKHWTNSISSNVYTLFYNISLTWISYFASKKIILIPIFSLGASIRNLNVIYSKSNHSQNSNTIYFLNSFSINSLSNQKNNLCSLDQNTHKTKFSIFNLPTQSLYEQSGEIFYDSNYTKLHINRAVTPSNIIKSNYNISLALKNLLINNSNHFNVQMYDYNSSSPLFQLNLIIKNIFNLFFVPINFFFKNSTKMSYLMGNILTLYSNTNMSSLRDENLLNIY